MFGHNELPPKKNFHARVFFVNNRKVMIKAKRKKLLGFLLIPV
jgi:hypothetical protein